MLLVGAGAARGTRDGTADGTIRGIRGGMDTDGITTIRTGTTIAITRITTATLRAPTTTAIARPTEITPPRDARPRREVERA